MAIADYYKGCIVAADMEVVDCYIDCLNKGCIEVEMCKDCAYRMDCDILAGKGCYKEEDCMAGYKVDMVGYKVVVEEDTMLSFEVVVVAEV